MIGKQSGIERALIGTDARGGLVVLAAGTGDLVQRLARLTTVTIVVPRVAAAPLDDPEARVGATSTLVLPLVLSGRTLGAIEVRLPSSAVYGA